MSRVPLLFQPLKLRGVTLSNRIIVSPMCQYSAVDGVPNDWHLVHLGSRAVGGAGMVIVEATAVVPEGRISPADCGIYSDAAVEAWQRITAFIHAQGSMACVQLAHAGRKASTSPPWLGGAPVSPGDGGWTPLAPSPIPFTPAHTVPTEMSLEDIAELRAAFVRGARASLQAGFKALELHFAHGYCVHEFLSPLTNHRHDSYGGDFEGRTRLAREITADVRAVWPDDLPLLVRISATDWVTSGGGGWGLEHSVALCKALLPLGVDFIDVSSGGAVPTAVIPVGPGFQVPLAARIRAATGAVTGAVGLITQPAQAETILQTGQADAVLLARELLRDPYWPLHAAAALKAPDAVKWPDQYLRAK